MISKSNFFPQCGHFNSQNSSNCSSRRITKHLLLYNQLCFYKLIKNFLPLTSNMYKKMKFFSYLIGKTSAIFHLEFIELKNLFLEKIYRLTRLDFIFPKNKKRIGLKAFAQKIRKTKKLFGHKHKNLN